MQAQSEGALEKAIEVVEKVRAIRGAKNHGAQHAGDEIKALVGEYVARGQKIMGGRGQGSVRGTGAGFVCIMGIRFKEGKDKAAEEYLDEWEQRIMGAEGKSEGHGGRVNMGGVQQERGAGAGA